MEAILFTSDAPLSAARIAELAELRGERAVKDAVAALNDRYEREGAAFSHREPRGRLPDAHAAGVPRRVARLLRDRSDSRLSQAALETLAIVAYRQPILRADVEAIRGVACGEVLRGLLERQLIKIVGRAQVIGRPMLYGTTRRFLEVFGLESLEDLPEGRRTPSAGRASATCRAGPQATPAPPARVPAGDQDPATQHRTSQET